MSSVASPVLTCIFLLNICPLVLGEVYSNSSAYYKLRSSLFKGYSSHIRPVRNVSDSTHVGLDVHIKSIVDIDVKIQKMSQVVYMDIVWRDEFITWDPQEFDGVKNFLVRQRDVWVPDLMFGPHISGQSLQMGHDDMLLMVWYDGRVSWTPDLTIETSCSMDITNYPFDEQRCTWKLYPWMSDNEHVKLTVRNLSTIFDRLISDNVEWRVVNVKGQTCDYKSEFFEFSCVSFTYTLKRRPTFLVLTVVVPTVMLALISTLAFALPSESGEKISLCVAPVVAIVLMLSIMMKVLPESSLQTSVFVIYLVILVVCSTLSVVLTVLVVSLHTRPACLPLPKIAVRFVRLFSCDCACFKSSRSLKGAKSAQVNGSAVHDGNCLGDTNTYMFRQCASYCMARSDDDYNGRSRGSVSDVVPPVSEYDNSKERRNCSLTPYKCCWRHDAEVTWPDVASACDYVLFRFFLAFILVATVICFGTMDRGIWNLIQK